MENILLESIKTCVLETSYRRVLVIPRSVSLEARISAADSVLPYMAGAILILMGIFRLGALIKFIPYTITTGFTAGIAVTIFIGQIKDFFGLSIQEDHALIETVEKLVYAVRAAGTASAGATLVGAVSLFILIAWPKVNKVIPGSLIAVIVGIVMVSGLGIKANTIGNLYTIKGTLLTFQFPKLSLASMGEELGNAFTIAFLAAIESLLSCVVADGMANWSSV